MIGPAHRPVSMEHETFFAKKQVFVVSEEVESQFRDVMANGKKLLSNTGRIGG